jgi:hypothetical protein
MRTFKVDMDAELHGFGGYFECTLYKDIMISINPDTHSKGKRLSFSKLQRIIILILFFQVCSAGSQFSFPSKPQ